MNLNDNSVKDRAAALKLQRETRRPFEDTAHRLENKKFNLLLQIAQDLSQSLTTDQLVDRVAQQICTLLKADQVFLLLQDARSELHIRAEYSRLGAPNRNFVSQSVCDRAICGNAILISEALSDSLFQFKQSVMALNLRSVMACPITPVGSVIPTGVLYVCSYTSGELFNQDDLQLVKACASIVSLHLDRTRVLAEKDRLLKEFEAVAASRGRVVEVASHELGLPTQRIWMGVDVGKNKVKHLKASLGQGLPVTLADLEDIEQTLAEAATGLASLKQRFIEPLRNFNLLDMQIDRMSATIMRPATVMAMQSKWREMATRHHLMMFERLPVSLQCDHALIDSALTCLIDNAVKYSPEGTTINMTATLNKDHLQITVEDEGIGILAEDLPFVCNWLVRGSNVANLAGQPSGLGIGLYAARRIIEAHGGGLKIESVLGKGTRVVVWLPAFVERV